MMPVVEYDDLPPQPPASQRMPSTCGVNSASISDRPEYRPKSGVSLMSPLRWFKNPPISAKMGVIVS